MKDKHIEAMPIKRLLEGDCFFHYTTAQSVQRQHEIFAVDEARAERGQNPLTTQERSDYYAAVMNGFVVVAIVRQTQERCARRLSDGKNFIWYDGDDIVYFAKNRESFMQRIQDMKDAQKRMSEEQRKATPRRSKKANRAVELA